MSKTKTMIAVVAVLSALCLSLLAYIAHSRSCCQHPTSAGLSAMYFWEVRYILDNGDCRIFWSIGARTNLPFSTPP